MGYTLEDLETLLDEFYTNHPNLHKKETYEQVRLTERNGATNFLYWLSHDKRYKEEYYDHSLL